MTMQIKTIIRPLIITIVIFLIPLFANHRVEGWNWTFMDFLFMGLLILGSGLIFEFVSRKAGSMAYKSAVAIAVLMGFLLIWVNLAVGIIGEDNPANLLYLILVLLGLITAFIGRFESKKMARLMFKMAIVQMLIPVIAFIVWRYDFGPGVAQVFALNTGFALMFVISGLLFRHSFMLQSKS